MLSWTGKWKSDRFSLNRHTASNTKVDRYTMRRSTQSLKSFFADAWLDIVVLAILGAATAGVWVAPHTFNRLFPVSFFDGSNDIVWTQFAYPYISPPLGTTVVGMLCALVPMATILIAQIWLRSFADAAHAMLGLTYALVTGTLFQVTIKKTIGGLRPHFLSVCEPLIPQNVTSQGLGYRNVMFTVGQVCHGDIDKINEALESFPSSHGQVSFAGLGYLTIYLFAHLQIQHQRRPSLWRMGLVLAPLLLATYVTSSLVLSYNHHGYDVMAGGLIGSMVALFSYRMVFMSIWDRRWNVVPRVRYGAADSEPFEASSVNANTDANADVDAKKTSESTVVDAGPDSILPL